MNIMTSLPKSTLELDHFLCSVTNLSGSFKDDVINEAKILVSLCHPNLPYLFGVCTTSRPYQLVMQFHGIGNETITILRDRKELSNSKEWVVLCSQLMNAVEYLHHSAHLLHNNIKGDNVLLTDAVLVCHAVCNHQVVLVDFGKATAVILVDYTI